MPSPPFLLVLSLAVSLAVLVGARPFNPNVDQEIGVMNFALFIESLSFTFLSDGVAKFTLKDFEDTGYDPFVYGRMKEMALHDKKHVDFLTAAVADAGAQPFPACQYNGSYENAHSFVENVSRLKSITTALYTGSEAFVNPKQYATLMASILATEARHSAWTDSAAQKFNPWSTALETPLSQRHVYSLVAQYVCGCPENHPIKLQAFQTLTFLDTPVPGQRVRISAGQLNLIKGDGQKALSASSTWVAFLTGEGIKYAVTSASDGGHPNVLEVVVPKGLKGTVYAILTTSNRKLTDATTKAGPTPLTFHFNSGGMLE